MGLTNAELETILHRIHESRNFDFRNYKRATLRRRIERRMADRGRKTGREYMALLEREPDEFQSLISSMLIKVTAFFRDPEMWERLRESVLPELLASHRTDEELRVWCAGCATGEEAYSAAIAIAEVLGSRFTGRELKVFGTDVDPVAIAHARRGIYSDRAVEDVPKKLLGRWFSRSPEGWGLRPDIRRTVVFGVNNLVSDAPISRLNLILCRNVFIYLDAQLQKRALARFHYALRHHGILVLGKSELIPYAAK